MKYVLTTRALKEFHNHLIENEKSPATIDKYLRDLRKLYDYLPAEKELDKSWICGFKASLISRYQSSSVNSMLAAVNSFLGFIGWDSLRVKQVRMQRRMFRSEGQELSLGDYKRLLKAAEDKRDERLYYIMLTLCSTGIRVSELPYITIEALAAGKAEVVCKNKTRVILLPSALRRQLLVYSKKHRINQGSIFITSGGKPVDRSNIWAQMKAAAQAAGIESRKVYPHNLRHLFARTYYSREKDVVKLADILGHSSIETTRIYTCTSIHEHRMRIDSLGLMPEFKRRI